MKTRAQQDMSLAERLVTQVYEANKAPEKKQVRDIYGGLCHKFPILVRTCGLCQAVAFSMDKATSKEKDKDTPRNKAHQLLLDHVAEIAGYNNRQAFLEAVQTGNALEYIQHTRRILASWIYFKRFAVSILGVADASHMEDGANETGSAS